MKKPICAVLTDTHSNEDNLEQIEGVFDEWIKICNKLNVCGVHCGDVFTERFPGDPLKTLLSVQDCFDKVNKGIEKTYMIPGNHDKTEYTSPNSYLDLFLHYENIKVTRIIDIIEFNDNIRFCFIPYFLEGESYTEVLNLMISSLKVKQKIVKKKKILFTHIGIEGAIKNSGDSVVGGVPQELFNYFDLVIVGHYHNKNHVNGNIHYIGSGCQNNYGEDERKGITVIFDDLTIKQLRLQTKKYIKLEFDVSEVEEIRQAVEEYRNSDDNVRIVLRGSIQDTETFDKKFIEEAGIEVKKKNTVEASMEVEEVEDIEIVVQDKDTIITAWQEYGKTMNLENSKIKLGRKELQTL